MAKVFGINTKIRGKVGEYIYRRQSIYNVGQKAGNNGGYERNVSFGLVVGEFCIPIFDTIGRCSDDEPCNQRVVCLSLGGHHSEGAHHRTE